MHNKRDKSSQKIPNECVYDVNDKDIIDGIRLWNSRAGNEAYRDVVKQFAKEYESHIIVAGAYRTMVAHKIIDHVNNDMGGRFVRVDDDYRPERWYVLSDEYVPFKVNRALVNCAAEIRNGMVVPMKRTKRNATISKKIRMNDLVDGVGSYNNAHCDPLENSETGDRTESVPANYGIGM